MTPEERLFEHNEIGENWVQNLISYIKRILLKHHKRVRKWLQKLVKWKRSSDRTSRNLEWNLLSNYVNLGSNQNSRGSVWGFSFCRERLNSLRNELSSLSSSSSGCSWVSWQWKAKDGRWCWQEDGVSNRFGLHEGPGFHVFCLKYFDKMRQTKIWALVKLVYIPFVWRRGWRRWRSLK